MNSLGEIYVTDTGNNRVQVFDANGNFSRFLGIAGTGIGQFSFPFGIAIDDTDAVYVADNGNNRVQKFVDGQASTFSLSAETAPVGVGISPVSGTVYVSWSNNTIVAYSEQGSVTFGGSGTADGQFRDARNIDVDDEGVIYVADRENDRVQAFTPDGVFIYKFGSTGAANGQFKGPIDLAVGENGRMYVTDTSNDRVQVFDLLAVAAGTARMRNSIIAANSALQATPDVAGAYATLGGNIVGNVGLAVGFVPNANVDQVGTSTAPIDPRLTLLRNNGGTTLTHAPLAGSPAIDRAMPLGGPAVDQVEVLRPQGQSADVGAVEQYFGEVVGTVYIDENRNGIRDADESALDGVTVFADLNENGEFEVGEPNAISRSDDPQTPLVDEGGRYAITGLPPGDYLLVQLFPDGFAQTSPQPVDPTVAPVVRELANSSTPVSDRIGWMLGILNFPPSIVGERLVGLTGNRVFSIDLNEPTRIATVADSSLPMPGGTGFNDFRAAQQDGEIVAFEGYDSVGRGGIYISDFQGTISTLVDRNVALPDVPPDFTLQLVFLQSVSQGVVAFFATNPSSENGLFAGTDSDSIVVLANQNMQVPGQNYNFSFLSSSALEGSHFAIIGGTFGPGVYVGTGNNEVTLVADGSIVLPGTNATFSIPFSHNTPAISGGTVSFFSNLSNGMAGIFEGSGPNDLRCRFDSNAHSQRFWSIYGVRITNRPRRQQYGICRTRRLRAKWHLR